MVILSTYSDSLQKIKSNEPDLINMPEIAILAVPIFRGDIFSRVLLAVLDIFLLSLFSWGATIFGMPIYGRSS